MANGVLNFGIGDQFKYIPLSIINDTTDEGTDNLCLVLRNASGAVIGTPSQHIYSILDDDTPPPSIFAGVSLSTSTVAENAGPRRSPLP